MGVQFVPQLNGSDTAPVDCGVMATRYAIDFATQGRQRPQRGAIRDNMGVPSGGTNSADWSRALRTQFVGDKWGGTGIPHKRKVGGSLDDVKRKLRNGQTIITGVHYGELRRAYPGKTGSESFDGWHAIFLRNLLPEGLQVFDSLNDGRYQGCPYGRVTMADPAQVWKAMKTYGEATGGAPGSVTYVSLHRLDSDEPAPEPPPVDPCQDMRDALGDAYNELAAAGLDADQLRLELTKYRETRTDWEPEEGATIE